MKVVLQYNRKDIILEVADERVADVVQPNDVKSYGSPEELINTALYGNDPDSFRSFLDASGKTLVIVNDGTRPTPTRCVLDVIADHLDHADVEFMVATGAHRMPTREEYDHIFGDLYERFSSRIHVHDARRDDEMVHIGTSANGTEMVINRKAVEAEKILVIGSVEPHYFAGYTGGRKGILPGIAALRTIEQNHKHALHHMAKSLQLEGNPVHEDMIDALKILKNRIFGIMTVLDKHHSIFSVSAGDIHSSFYLAIDKAQEIFVVPVAEAADIVVSVARYPMDIDLYQAQKSIDNGKLVLKDGGILILVSSCRDGLGDDAFVKLLSSHGTPEDVLENIKLGYKLGYHKAGKMAEVFQRGEVWAKTDLPGEKLEKIFIKPVNDLQKALNEAFRIKGPDSKAIFLTDGSVTVPLIKNTILEENIL